MVHSVIVMCAMTERVAMVGAVGMTEFFMPMKPPTTTAQQHKVTGSHFYDPPALKAARAKLEGHLAAHIPATPYAGPVELVTTWCFPVTGKHRNGEYKYTRPDTDNLQKLLKDCMTRCGYWKDDALVCREIVEKFWADIPGIYIKIKELT